MVSPVLRVKISPPPVQPNHVQRRHAVEQLERDLWAQQGFARPLTLVSAPAGFGKTTLVRSWIATRQEPLCWFTLDREDSQPERFWTYVIQSLRTVHPSIGTGALDALRSEGLSTSSDTVIDTLLTPLLNDLFGITVPTLFVLDDYHHVDSPQIQHEMAFFLENLPPTLHLVVTTRSDPPWPLPRYRARGQMVEVRLQELRFSPEETDALLQRTPQVHLTPDQIQVLWQRTEGWVTGLQLAALSLAQSDNVPQFLLEFTGSHRHVLHFLSEEILNQQSPALQTFLLQTSILERFCAGLCDAVTATEASDSHLAYLQRENIFILPLDETGEWYRYHALFGDLLQHHLRRQCGHEIAALHQRAVHWFLGQGDPNEALLHAVRGGQLELAAEILDTYERQIMQAEDPWRFRSSLERFPQDLLLRYPRLLAHKALYSLIHLGQEQARHALDLAEQALAEGAAAPEELEGIIAAIKTYYHVYLQDFEQAQTTAHRALQLLAPDDHYWRMNVAIYSGDAQLFAGCPREAYKHYLQAQEASDQTKNRVAQLTAGFKVATSLTYLGRLHAAQQTLDTLIQRCRQQGLGQIPRLGLVWTLMGELKREEGLLDEAERCVDRGLLFSEPEAPSFGWNSITKVALELSQGLPQQALQTLDDIDALHEAKTLPGFVTNAADQWRAKVLLDLGRVDDSRSLLESSGVAIGSEAKPGQERAFLVLAQLLLTEGNYEEAQRVLHELAPRVEAAHYPKLLLELRLLLAFATNEQGHSQQSRPHLEDALFIALQCGFYQTWLDVVQAHPRFCTTYLQEQAASHGAAASLAKRLLQALGAETSPAAYTTQAASPGSAAPKSTDVRLVEELSARELEVLSLIQEGLSNDAIAQNLFLSLGTVKWHTSNIYGKLGVRNRTKAVAVARELGLLQV